MRRRDGWTLIELMTVMVVLGLLAGIMVRKYIDLSRTAFAAKISGEFVTIRLAAYNYEADNQNQFPSDEPAGVIPPEMVRYLPAGFSFTTPTYLLDWDNRMPSRNPYGLAISMTTNDPRLMNAVAMNMANRGPYVIAGNRLMYVLLDATGNW
jgi:prepilin-type N-terminal cleavage/methylation domain-containing protein